MSGSVGTFCLMMSAEALLSHHEWITAIARATSLRSEHVEIVALVVAIEKAISAEGHTEGDGTCTTSVGDKICGPH